MSFKFHFRCTGCGQCCTGTRDYFVEVTPREQRRIQTHLAVSWRWFRRRYLFRFDETIESLRMDGGRCVFLDGANRCRIYAVRPQQCRTYPLWPELAHRAAWNAEAKRCEGIGVGADIGAKLRKLIRIKPIA